MENSGNWEQHDLRQQVVGIWPTCVGVAGVFASAFIGDIPGSQAVPPTIITVSYLTMLLPPNTHKGGPTVLQNQGKASGSMYVATFRCISRG